MDNKGRLPNLAVNRKNLNGQKKINKFSFAGCSGLLDLALAIDASGSIRAERFPIVLDYMVKLVNELEVHPDKTRIGTVQFSTDSETAFYLNVCSIY